MSPESKRIKVFTLVSLAYGLVSIILGIVMVAAMGEEPLSGVSVSGSGVVSLLPGIRGSLLANVPSKADKLAKLAGLLALVQIALGALCVYATGTDELATHPLGCVLVAIGLILTLVVFFLARSLNKKNLSK